MKKNSKIFVAGGTGMVGRAILDGLVKRGYSNILASFFSKKPEKNISKNILFKKINLLDQIEVKKFFQKEKPAYVILAAARVGGIHANNKFRADFIYQNLQIQNNVIHNSYLTQVKKLLFLGSSCIYPRDCPQPMKEEYLLTSPLEYTNEPYAIAKIAGIKMCESYNIQYHTNFISVMPTNLYGYHDKFDLENSHVLPAMIRKMHLAKLLDAKDWDGLKKDLKIEDINTLKKVLRKNGLENGSLTLWGSGEPFREFLFVSDLADACLFIMDKMNFTDLVKGKKECRNSHINIGSGSDLKIKDLAHLIKEVVGYAGEIKWDLGKPDGTPKKLLDVGKLNQYGWKPKIPLNEGIVKVYGDYCKE